MGADLYLNSVFEKNWAKYEPKYSHWEKKRDALQKAGRKAAAEEAEKEVSWYWDKISEKGYFRDNYNFSSLLWLFGLSWWEDVEEPLADLASRIDYFDAELILQKLKEREPLFEANLKKVEPDKGDTREEAGGFLRDQYRRLKTLLRDSIRYHDEYVHHQTDAPPEAYGGFKECLETRARVSKEWIILERSDS